MFRLKGHFPGLHWDLFGFRVALMAKVNVVDVVVVLEHFNDNGLCSYYVNFTRVAVKLPSRGRGGRGERKGGVKANSTDKKTQSGGCWAVKQQRVY